MSAIFLQAHKSSPVTFRSVPHSKCVCYRTISLLSKCGKDKGDYRGLSEGTHPACSSGKQQNGSETETDTKSRLLQTLHPSSRKDISIFLCKVGKARVPALIMCTFYRETTECILTCSITVWFSESKATASSA